MRASSLCLFLAACLFFAAVAPFAMVEAASVKVARAGLRSGCDADSSAVAIVEAGVPLAIRYSLAGENTTCYKVAIVAGGKTIEGYLSANEIEGIDEFEKARRDAAWLDMAQVMGSLPAIHKSNGDSLAARAANLIEASQPGKALQLLE